MTGFEPYGHAIFSLAGVALIALVLLPMSAAHKAKAGVATGAVPAGGYDDPAYRLYRAHVNATENIGIFGAVTMAAMMAGVVPWLVNWLCALFFVARLAHAVIYVRGIGAQSFGLRTGAFIFGALICLLLALSAIIAVLS